MRKAIRGLFGVIVAGVPLLLCLSTGTFAQGNATLSGTVTDPAGALIPGAEVTATHNGTGMATRSLTNQVGAYEFILQPGLYTLTAELPGFETGIDGNVELSAGQQVLRNFTLEIGRPARSDHQVFPQPLSP